MDFAYFINGASPIFDEPGDSGPTNNVLKYHSNDVFNGPIEVAPMVKARAGPICAIFNSLAHNGRPVLIVATGAWNSAEILDFTQEGSSWQESKLIF